MVAPLPRVGEPTVPARGGDERRPLRGEGGACTLPRARGSCGRLLRPSPPIASRHMDVVAPAMVPHPDGSLDVGPGTDDGVSPHPSNGSDSRRGVPRARTRRAPRVGSGSLALSSPSGRGFRPAPDASASPSALNPCVPYTRLLSRLYIGHGVLARSAARPHHPCLHQRSIQEHGPSLAVVRPSAGDTTPIRQPGVLPRGPPSAKARTKVERSPSAL